MDHLKLARSCGVAYSTTTQGEIVLVATPDQLAAFVERVSPTRDAAIRALRAVIAHWDEFGPDYNFERVLDVARFAAPTNGSAG